MLLAGALVAVAGCGPDERGVADAMATGAVSAAPGHVTQPPQLRLPGEFPDQFPPPPAPAVVTAMEVRELALLGPDFAVEYGTVLTAEVRWRHGRGQDGEVHRVLDRFRRALPAAGWRLSGDGPTATGPDPRQNRPGHRLHAEGQGISEVSVTVQPQETATQVRATARTVARGRAPSQHPPMVTMPGWYQRLPEPPGVLRRYQVQVTASSEEPRTTYYLEYEQDPHQEGVDAAGAGAAVLARHYLQALPAAGWRTGPVRGSTETSHGGVVEATHVRVELAGHGAVGELHISHTTAADGRWLAAGASFTIRPASAPDPGEGPA